MEPSPVRVVLFRWLGVLPRGHRAWLEAQLRSPDFPRRQVLGTAALLVVVDLVAVLTYRALTGELPPWPAQAGPAGALVGTGTTLLTPEHARTRALRRAGLLPREVAGWYRRRAVAAAGGVLLVVCLLVVAVSG